MQIDFKDLIIDEEDRKLFLVDDIVLKAEALRHSILPRLENLLYLIIKEINEIYGVDVLEESKISKSPNFRISNREEPLKVNYGACSVWLGGKIKSDYWKALKKETGDISKHTPLEFKIQLSGENILCFLVVDTHLKLSDASYQIFDNWIEKNLLKIFPLMQEATVKYQFFCSDECKPFTQMVSYFAWKKEKKIFESRFLGETMNYPLDEILFQKIKNIFLYLFPIYQTFIDLSSGKEDQFDTYLSKIQNHFFEEIISEDNSAPIIAVEERPTIVLNELAERKIPVIPSIRWQVFQRDRRKCVACGRNSDNGIILHVDHIIPRSKGGENILSNYQTLCNVCNIGKSNRDDTNIRQMRG